MAGETTADESARAPWKRWVLLIWLAAAVVLIVWRWKGIGWFALPDTDDNMRMAQVRALLDGQRWFDLRQYKLDPPWGASIHWSRLVDLPLAAIILATKPFVGGYTAERIAAAVAPLLPLGVGLFAVAAAARRLAGREAYALAAAILLCGQSTMGMWTPLRIDHHGWQIALMLALLAGLVDPRPARGGAIAGLAAALSMTIGLEMLPQIAAGGAATALMWGFDRAQDRRLATFGIALAAGAALGFAGFASYDNRYPVCDALSPVWLSVALVAGALAAGLAWTPAASRGLRLALIVVAGAALAAFYVLAWPQCVGRLEGASPELARLWLSHVREAEPSYKLAWKLMATLFALPAVGLLGSLAALWRFRAEPERLRAWAGATALSASAFALLFWQVRAGPVAQALAAPGAAMLGWWALPRVRDHSAMPVRVFGTVVLFAAVSGLMVQYVMQLLPDAKDGTVHGGRMRAVSRANARCPTLPALTPIERLPAATVLTFVDLGPRLINVTHHRAIAGPYHRNGAAILDVMHAWRGTADTARDVVRRHGVGLVLICPGMSESTIYMAEAPKGFYAQLVAGRTPAWLSPVTLPKWSPYRAWKVVG